MSLSTIDKPDKKPNDAPDELKGKTTILKGGSTTLRGRIYSMETFGTLDGPGIRFVVFLQGCPLRCKYCHNRDTWAREAGREVSVEELVQEVDRYKDFYQNSGGGVTASGGEPTAQAPFVTAFFKAVKERGLNTALDTSGFTSVETVEELLAITDLVILDIKHALAGGHLELTGVENSKILAFVRHLKQIKKPMWIRQVLIPGITDNKSQLEGLAEFLKGYDNLERVELLGYHKMGTHKWQLSGCEDPLEEVPAATTEEVERAREFLRSKGLQNVT